MSTSLQPQPLTKLFIQMSGAPGSGKSTIARVLRHCINGVVIDHDVLRSSLLNPQTLPFDQAAKQAYTLQWTLAQDMLKQGLSVIIDSPCNYQEILGRGAALASQYGCIYWYVECKVQDLNLLDQRLRTRNPMASQRTALDRPPAAAQTDSANEDAHALFTKWIESPCRPDSNTIVVDSTGNLEMLRDQIMRQIMN